MQAPGRPGKRNGPVVAVAAAVLVLAGAGLALWRPWGRPAAPSTPVVPMTVAASRIAEPKAPVATRESSADEPARPVEKTPAKAEKKPASGKTAQRNQADRSDEAEVQPEATAETPAPHPVLSALHQGQEQFKQGQYAAAIESFNQAVSINAKYAPAYAARGMVHQKQEDYPAAIKDYSEAVRLSPQAATYANRGVCYTKLSQNDLALADFNLALGIHPEFVPALNGRGRLFLQQGKLQQAVHDFSEAIRLAPNGFMGYQNRAAAKRAMGDRAGAREDAKRAQVLRQGG
jgi:tetratricopeptide (TPR) repeat protein